ncbi:MAG: DUF932 domain-containing protein [Rhodocyclaceae bacterium]|nr:DUF932 domain-containing protein [Rhodocyclaceae bacterium]
MAVLATTAQYTSIRVVCNNTLQLAVASSHAGSVRRCRTALNLVIPPGVKRELGLGLTAWDTFIINVRPTGRA